MNAPATPATPAGAASRALEARVGRVHLRQRLGIETDREAWVFGQGINFFHIENWYSVHALIRSLLRLLLLHERGRRNALDLRVRRNELRIAGLPRAFAGYTILHASDLHLDMSERFPTVLAEHLRGLEYDIAVLTGDFRARTYGAIEPALAGMRVLRPSIHAPVYAVLGNHDSIRMVTGLEALDVRVLLNEHVTLERGGARIHLAGIDDPHYYRADNLEKAADPLPAGECAILLAHSPEIYRQAAHAGFAAMLCGHTHGGQICLPGGIPLLLNANCPRRYCAGGWSYGALRGYTSVGAGVSVVDVRINCPPEVVLHRLAAA
ncbi:MAG: metallophosphoesterase family protein [Gammaproteobacteria bacterium]|nr:metallophosphoesterase family protein [Gammaproteobacteria bacterium]